MSVFDELKEMDLEGSTIFVDPNFEGAIVGVTTTDNVVYDYDRMVKWLAKEYNIDEMEAMSFIDENTIRTLPYCDEPKPIIMMRLREAENETD